LQPRTYFDVFRFAGFAATTGLGLGGGATSGAGAAGFFKVKGLESQWPLSAEVAGAAASAARARSNSLVMSWH
jgi:hypothetical protein